MARAGATTMVGTCVGVGLEARERRVTLVSCLLAAAIFCGDRARSCFFGKTDCRPFCPCRKSCPCGIRLFLRDGPDLRVRGHICDTVFRISGMGTARAPLVVSLLKVAIVLGGGWMLRQQVPPVRSAALSCRRFHGYWSVNAGRRFRLPAAKSTRFDAFRLKS